MQGPPRQFDPNDPITVTITRTSAQWNEFLSFLDAEGKHRMVRPIIDAVLQAAQSPPPSANGPVTEEILPEPVAGSHRRSKGAGAASDAG